MRNDPPQTHRLHHDRKEKRGRTNRIVNRVFVEMLEKLGYDIQITYVKKETNI